MVIEFSIALSSGIFFRKTPSDQSVIDSNEMIVSFPKIIFVFYWWPIFCCRNRYNGCFRWIIIDDYYHDFCLVRLDDDLWSTMMMIIDTKNFGKKMMMMMMIRWTQVLGHYYYFWFLVVVDQNGLIFWFINNRYMWVGNRKETEKFSGQINFIFWSENKILASLTIIIITISVIQNSCCSTKKKNLIDWLIDPSSTSNNWSNNDERISNRINRI